MSENISKFLYNHIEWIDISQKGPKEISYLRNSFSFDSNDIDECKRETKHSTIFVKKDYIYFEILFPIYNRKTKLIGSSEINFFIKDNMLITVHEKNVDQLSDFFEEIQNNDALARTNFKDNPIRLLSGILSHLFASCFPMLNHMDEDITELEKEIFTTAHKTNTETVLRLKWNVINFRRTIQSYKNIIEKLVNTGDGLFPMNKLKIYYSDLLEKTKDIWATLENQKESISALQQTNDSLVSFQLNEIMKTLAIISALMMPASFITSLFGVNTKIPFTDLPFAFFGILGLCATVVLLFFIFFKKKKWM